MAALPAILSVVGTVVSAAGSIAAGNAQKAAADFQAAQLRQNATYQQAAGQRESMEAERKAKLANSAALAYGAASGLGTDDNDPSFQNLTYSITERGKYQGEVATADANIRAQGMQNQANAAVFSGQQAQQAGEINAFSSILGGASSFFKNYGGGGPSISGAASDPTIFGF